MKEEYKSRWRPRVRTDIEWDGLINVPEAEEMRKAEVRSRRDVSTRHPALSQGNSSVTASNDSLSKAEAKKMRRLQRHEDLDSKSRKQKIKAQIIGEKDDSHDEQDEENASESDGAEHGQDDEGENREQPPFLSIGLIGQPK